MAAEHRTGSGKAQSRHQCLLDDRLPDWKKIRTLLCCFPCVLRVDTEVQIYFYIHLLER